MSADARPPTSDDERAWQPSSPSIGRDREEAVSGIQQGFQKIIEGGSEAASSVALLVILLLLSLLGEDDDEPMDAQERSAEWDERAEPIQERFEESDVDEEDLADAISWARSR